LVGKREDVTRTVIANEWRRPEIPVVNCRLQGTKSNARLPILAT